ncbi:MAG: Crp/Fnr family transcriptional regulator [Rubrivivax sp.]|nr:Crp/Fnr family transcriptional regulator [Rubrivivax sp.]
MSDATLLSMLRKHPFVDSFLPEHIEKLRTIAREVTFDKDQLIFREGEDSHDFYLIGSGRVALEMQEPDYVLRVQTLSAGDELGWSSILVGRGKYFQARVLEPVEALAFDGAQLFDACREDRAFGFALMYRMLGVVSERLQATRLQLHDMYSPMAKRAGT